MRRLLLLIGLSLIFAAAIGVLPVAAEQEGSQANEVALFIDDMQFNFELAPVIQNGRLLVPFRAIAETLNVQVSWDEINRRIMAENEDNSLEMTIDSEYARLNNYECKMDVAPLIVQGRTLIPARFFSEAFGCKVEWNPDSKTVRIFSAPKAMKVLGFYALGDEKTSSWTDLFNCSYPQASKGNTEVVSDLAFGWYSLDEEGTLLTKSSTGWQRPDGWERVIKAADDYKIETQMLIHMTNREGRLSRLLNDDNAVKRAVASINKEAHLFKGVNLDFEGLGWNDSAEQLDETRADFNNFIGQLSRELRKSGLELTLTLHAPNSAYLGYDYQTLGGLADHIVIMAYDYGQSPEPVGRVEQAVEMACSSVPADRLILGISAYSETAESIVSKIGIAKRYNLEGIALWRLGLLSDEMWDCIQDNIVKREIESSQLHD